MLGPTKPRRPDQPMAVSLVPWVAERFTLSVSDAPRPPASARLRRYRARRDAQCIFRWRDPLGRWGCRETWLHKGEYVGCRADFVLNDRHDLRPAVIVLPERHRRGTS